MTHRKQRTTCPHTGDLMYDCRCGQCDTPPAVPPMSVEQALRALKDAAYEWGGEPYDETVAPAVDALISAVRAEVLREIGQK